MADFNKLIGSLASSGAISGFAGGLAGGALANALSGKKAKKLAGSALKVGGLALVGGLAYKAWQHHQQGKAAMSDKTVALPNEREFIPDSNDEEGTVALSLLLARSMIAAAKADGQIDTAESQKILNQINVLDLPAEDKAFLFEEYARPLDIATLARDVDTPEHAAEVYAANQIKVYMYDATRSTPQLSFTIRELKAISGDMFSASHNLPTDNGKKVYDQYGGQLIPPHDQDLVDEVTGGDGIEANSSQRRLSTGFSKASSVREVDSVATG